MSAPDETVLSAEERAALAHLEARAAADDPRLADHLEGLRAARRFGAAAIPDIGWVTTAVARTWARMSPIVWGPVLLLAGVALVVLGLATSLAVGVVGVAFLGVAMGMLVQHGSARIATARAVQARLVAGSAD